MRVGGRFCADRHRGPRTAAPLRLRHAGRRPVLRRPSPRSSDRGSIAATAVTTSSTPVPGSPRSSDRGSIAAGLGTSRAVAGAHVTAVLGPRLHCGNVVFDITLGNGRSPRSSDRGSIAACATGSPGWSRRSCHRGPRTAAPLRLAAQPLVRHRRPRVTAVLGPRLHCGASAASSAFCGTGRHRGPRTAAPLRQQDLADTFTAHQVTAVLGPRLHCGLRRWVMWSAVRLASPRSSDRGSIAAARRTGARDRAGRHRGPRTAAPLRQGNDAADDG